MGSVEEHLVTSTTPITSNITTRELFVHVHERFPFEVGRCSGPVKLLFHFICPWIIIFRRNPFCCRMFEPPFEHKIL